MADVIQLRRDTAANWTATNPTLAQGEVGFETDTLRFKIGTGATLWNSLAYIVDPLGVSMPGRLSASATLAEPTSDISGATSIHYVLTGRNGNILPLYSGGAWRAFTLTGSLSLSLAGLTADTVYDVFVYDNAGTPTLETLAWASSGAGTSTRATALATQDGRTVKSGDPTRLYLGTILIDAAGGAVSDAFTRRGVANWYNATTKRLISYNTNATWTAGGAAYQEANSGAGQIRGEFVSCVDRRFQTASITNYIASSTSGLAGIACALNGVLDANRLVTNLYGSFSLRGDILHTDRFIAKAGANYITMIGRLFSGATGFSGGLTYPATIVSEF